MYERWIAAQGGDPREEVLPTAPVVHEVAAPAEGYVSSLGAIEIGMAALRLGAGRQTKDDSIDHAVGIRCLKKRGDAVAAGEVLAEVHARDDASAKLAEAEVLDAYDFGDEAPPARPIVLETIA
jgi:thymidine phosphorylase